METFDSLRADIDRLRGAAMVDLTMARVLLSQLPLGSLIAAAKHFGDSAVDITDRMLFSTTSEAALAAAQERRAWWLNEAVEEVAARGSPSP